MNNSNNVIQHTDSIIVSPYNSRVEYIFQNGKIYYHKTLKKKLRFPFNFGVFPNTLGPDKKILKNIIYFKEMIPQWTYINTKIIGAIKFQDDKNIYHEKIISVPLDHPEENIIDIEHFCLEEIKLFIIQYYKVEGIKIKFDRFVDKNEGEKIYNYACSRYNVKKALENTEIQKKEKKNLFKQFSNFFKKNKRNSNSIISDNSSDKSSDINLISNSPST